MCRIGFAVIGTVELTQTDIVTKRKGEMPNMTDKIDELIKKLQNCLETKNTKIPYFQPHLTSDEIELLLGCLRTKKALSCDFDERLRF